MIVVSVRSHFICEDSVLTWQALRAEMRPCWVTLDSVRAPACSAGHAPAREASVLSCGRFPSLQRRVSVCRADPACSVLLSTRKQRRCFALGVEIKHCPWVGCTCLKGKGSTDLFSSVSLIVIRRFPEDSQLRIFDQ